MADLVIGFELRRQPTVTAPVSHLVWEGWAEAIAEAIQDLPSYWYDYASGLAAKGVLASRLSNFRKKLKATNQTPKTDRKVTKPHVCEEKHCPSPKKRRRLDPCLSPTNTTSPDVSTYTYLPIT